MDQTAAGGRLRLALMLAGLLAVGLLPSLIGAVILADMGRGSLSEVTSAADAARRGDYPWAITGHILGGALMLTLGLVQFSPHVRRTLPVWHRWAGRVLVGFVGWLALSGLWMNLRHPNPRDSLAHDMAQTVAALLLLACMALAIRAIRAGRVAVHRAWMARTYAVSLGAGTQTLLLFPLFLTVGLPPAWLEDIVFVGAWLLNLALSEAWIRRGWV